ncbi:uncharacterized protein DS421_16g537100 [Arachis hypogaea]|nr:uncharacterized protein DS421_16g537100 [Arachis hypogaea]
MPNRRKITMMTKLVKNRGEVEKNHDEGMNATVENEKSSQPLIQEERSAAEKEKKKRKRRGGEDEKTDARQKGDGMRDGEAMGWRQRTNEIRVEVNDNNGH